MNNQDYFQLLQDGLDDAMAIAKMARRRGRDPTTDVEIPLAVDLAERVEKLFTPLSIAEITRLRHAPGELRFGASRNSRLTAETAFPDAPNGR